jgi:hypothetical protein
LLNISHQTKFSGEFPMLLKWLSRLIHLVALLGTLAIFAACAPNLLIQTPTPIVEATTQGYTLSGTVRRGQPYVQNLTPNLTFQLLPIQAGWEIWVGDPTISLEAQNNFAMPVTPPFSAINARHLEGWHFRNLDNSGPNAAGDQNVNAPQERRQFCFVSNNNDFQSALASQAAGLPALAEAVANNAFPVHAGELVISDYTLGNLIPNQQAWFEQIEFTVTLTLDQPCDLF